MPGHFHRQARDEQFDFVLGQNLENARYVSGDAASFDDCDGLRRHAECVADCYADSSVADIEARFTFAMRQGSDSAQRLSIPGFRGYC